MRLYNTMWGIDRSNKNMRNKNLIWQGNRGFHSTIMEREIMTILCFYTILTYSDQLTCKEEHTIYKGTWQNLIMALKMEIM